MARLKKIVRFDQAASRVLKKADRSGKRHGASAVNAWAEVVGDDIATHTRGFALRDNRELVVFVDGGAWANQLTLMSSDLIERLNEHIGDEAVRSLRFTVSRRVQEGVLTAAAEDEVEAFYAIEELDPTPLSEVELAQAAAVAATIKEEPLRQAAMRAMIRDLELKKGKRSKVGRKRDSSPPS